MISMNVIWITFAIELILLAILLERSDGLS